MARMTPNQTLKAQNKRLETALVKDRESIVWHKEAVQHLEGERDNLEEKNDELNDEIIWLESIITALASK